MTDPANNLLLCVYSLLSSLWEEESPPVQGIAMEGFGRQAHPPRREGEARESCDSAQTLSLLLGILAVGLVGLMALRTLRVPLLGVLLLGVGLGALRGDWLTQGRRLAEGVWTALNEE